MEYLEGGSLQELIKSSKTNLDEHTTQWVLREILKVRWQQRRHPGRREDLEKVCTDEHIAPIRNRGRGETATWNALWTIAPLPLPLGLYVFAVW